MDAVTGKALTDLGSLLSGATLNLSGSASRPFSIVALTSPLKVGSVTFDVDGTRLRVENLPPYSINGEAPDGTYVPWTPAVGKHTVVVTPYSESAGKGVAGKSATRTFTVTDVAQVPFQGSAAALPATIQAEDFDLGGESTAYHDFDGPASGATGPRPGEGVDLQATAEGGYAIGKLRVGEWTEYTVDIAKAGTYDLGIRFATANKGGTAHFSLGGKDVGAAVTLPSTGAFTSFDTFSATKVPLPAGEDQVLRLTIDASAGSTEIGVIDELDIRDSASTAPVPARWPTSFKKGPFAPKAWFESAGTAYAGKIYAFGGYTDAEYNVNRGYASYDPATNAWTTLGTLPQGMPETHMGIANDGRYIYLAGGFGGQLRPDETPTQWISDELWRFDPVANTWLQLGTLPAPRGAGALAHVSGKLYYFGGNPADRVTNVGDLYAYDLAAGTWSKGAAMPDPKDHFSSAVIGTKIYAIGGEHGHDELHDQSNTVHVYDTATGKWSRKADMPLAKSHIEAGTFVSDGKIVMAGGQVANFGATTNVISYDPAANAWSTLAPELPAPRQGAIVKRLGSKIVVALGAEFTKKPQSETWIGELP